MATEIASGNGMSPDDLRDDVASEIGLIVEVWNQYRVCDELGGSNREVLESLERLTTDCLSRKPPDIEGARRATAKALMLMSGRDDF